MASANRRGKHVVLAELNDEQEEMLEQDHHKMGMNRSQYIRLLIEENHMRLATARAKGKKGAK